MLQRWETLTFLHWRYEPKIVARLLPPGLELDIFEGSAWVGLVPFKIVNLHPPGFPSLFWISNFPETNLRTYVRTSSGKPGVWFFTLEAARLLAVIGGRTLYGLPYRWAGMEVEASGDVVEYTSQRYSPWTPARSRIGIHPGESARATELAVFLTARFRLYTVLRGKLAFADVEHEPWPLREAQILQLDQNIVEACGLPPPQGEPVIHYSPGVQVRIGAIERELTTAGTDIRRQPIRGR